MDTVVKTIFGGAGYFDKLVNEAVNNFIKDGYELVMISPVTGTEGEYTDPYGKRATTISYSQSLVFQKK